MGQADPCTAALGDAQLRNFRCGTSFLDFNLA